MGILGYIVFLTVTLITIGYWFVRKRYTYWEKRGVVYAKPTFPHGSLTGAFKTRHVAHVIQDLYNEFKGKASFVGIYFFLAPTALILDLDLVKNILIKDFNYFTDRGFYSNEKDDPLSGHLFLLEGERWRNLRNKLSPTFTSGKMKYMFPTIVEVSEHLTEVINKMIENTSDVDVKDLAARFTTDVIGKCAFGIECNSLKDPNVEFRKKGRSILTNRRNPQIVEAFMNTFQDFSRKIGIKIIPEEISNFFMSVVRETVDYREKNNVVRNDFMQLLIQLKNHGSMDGHNVGNLTINEIAAQAFLFFIAGFETSSTLMGFCLYLLATNSEIQTKLRREILDVLKKHDGKLTYEAMKEMNYLEMVINETLRMYPALGHLVRKAIKDYSVPNSELIIEKETMIFIPVYAIHNDPDIHENPDKFDPDRFLPENVKKRHPFSFLPFGDGPRNCIGLRFGKMQASIGLIALLSNFKFDISSETDIPIKINVKSPLVGSDNVVLKLEKIREVLK